MTPGVPDPCLSSTRLQAGPTVAGFFMWVLGSLNSVFVLALATTAAPQPSLSYFDLNGVTHVHTNVKIQQNRTVKTGAFTTNSEMAIRIKESNSLCLLGLCFFVTKFS